MNRSVSIPDFSTELCSKSLGYRMSYDTCKLNLDVHGKNTYHKRHIHYITYYDVYCENDVERQCGTRGLSDNSSCADISSD